MLSETNRPPTLKWIGRRALGRETSYFGNAEETGEAVNPFDEYLVMIDAVNLVLPKQEPWLSSP